MAFRTNYSFQRSERDRIKQAKKEEKLKRRQERGAESPASTSPQPPDKRDIRAVSTPRLSSTIGFTG
jgi:hypothetical protein